MKGARAEPPRTAAFKRSGLFPLPAELPAEDRLRVAGLDPCNDRALAEDCWVGLGCIALNALYGAPQEGRTRRPGKVHMAALADMKSKITRFLAGESPVSFSFEDVVEDIRSKKVSYTGEEIQQSHQLTGEQIIRGLPPKGHGGSIPITPFLRGRTKFLMENPRESLLPVELRATTAVTAKVHIKKGAEMEGFGLLKNRGIIDWVPADSAYSDERGTYLSGLFGVVKPGKYTVNRLLVLRVIMNLVPVNGLFEVLRGDISCLPNATQWLLLCFSGGVEVNLSQGDMNSAFYLFSIPSAWRPFMCVNFQATGADIGDTKLDPSAWYRPTCVVLLMGWS